MSYDRNDRFYRTKQNPIKLSRYYFAGCTIWREISW